MKNVGLSLCVAALVGTGAFAQGQPPAINRLSINSQSVAHCGFSGSPGPGKFLRNNSTSERITATVTIHLTWVSGNRTDTRTIALEPSAVEFLGCDVFYGGTQGPPQTNATYTVTGARYG